MASTLGIVSWLLHSKSYQTCRIIRLFENSTKKFAENNCFDGKDVVFFNSYNSNYGQNHIDEFKSLVMKNGAKSFERKAIIQGRMGSQLSTKEFLSEVEALFTEK